MSAGFRAVQWNRAKLVYDAILLAGVALFIGAYLIAGLSGSIRPRTCRRRSTCASAPSAPARS